MKPNDIKQEVTAQIIELMQTGKLTFDLGWNKSLGFPRSHATGKAYRGINVLLLWISSFKNGFQSNYWLTFNHAKKVGGAIKKGSKGTMITYFENVKVVDKESKEEKFIPMLKKFVVFNLEQCEGIEAPINEQPSLVSFNENNEIEELVTALGVEVNHGGGQAFYSPAYDKIQMPNKTDFYSETNYYATLLHECGHATGHESRTGRLNTNSLSKKDYAFEELVAELTAAFFSSHFGYIDGHIENHAAYLQSWLQALQNDTSYIFKAASLASDAFDFLINAYETSKTLNQKIA